MPSALMITAIIAIIIIGLTAVAVLIVATVLLLVVKNLVMEVRERLDPLAAKANTLLITANEMADTVQNRTEHIADQAVHTSTAVGNRVETTSRLLERILAVPVIKGSAAVAGVRSGIRIWRELRRDRRQAREGGYAA